MLVQAKMSSQFGFFLLLSGSIGLAQSSSSIFLQPQTYSAGGSGTGIGSFHARAKGTVRTQTKLSGTLRIQRWWQLDQLTTRERQHREACRRVAQENNVHMFGRKSDQGYWGSSAAGQFGVRR